MTNGRAAFTKTRSRQAFTNIKTDKDMVIVGFLESTNPQRPGQGWPSQIYVQTHRTTKTTRSAQAFTNIQIHRTTKTNRSAQAFTKEENAWSESSRSAGSSFGAF